MALIAWLKREGFGSYATLDEFVGELARRSTSALGGLGAALVGASPADLAEVGQGTGQNVCTDVVRDLRVPKGARLAALKAVLSARAGAQASRLFAGASDLLGDARLSQADREYLLRSGLKGLLDAIPSEAVNVELLRGAHAAAECAKAGSETVVREIVGAFPATHASVQTIQAAALGERLPEELAARWLDVLTRQCKAARNAPPAARRLGTAPEWPPMAPDTFRPLLTKAEDAAGAPKTTAGPAALGATELPSRAPAPPATKPAGPERPRLGAGLQEGVTRTGTSPGTVGKPLPPGSVPRTIPRGVVTEGPRPPPAAKADGPKVQPPLRARGKGGSGAAQPEPEASYTSDAIQVDPARLRSTPIVSRPPNLDVPLMRLRFGEQIDLLARRGTRALERLMAAFDARAAIVGTQTALVELERAAKKRGGEDVNGPALDELFALATSEKATRAWKEAARAILTHMGPDRAAALDQ